MSTVDLDAIAREWLNQCGPCDYGMPEYGCTHPQGDYRPVMLRLVEEVERLRVAACSALCRDVEDDRDRLRADLDVMYRVRDGQAAEVDRLRGVLREVLGEFTDKGSIGAIHNVLRSRWVNVGTVDRWRAVLTGEDTDGTP